MVKYGRWTREEARAEARAERVRGHIEQVEGRHSLEYWAENTPLLETVKRIEDHFPDALEPLRVFDPQRRCRKCGGKGQGQVDH